MTRVDVMLDLQKGKGTRYECIVPDDVAHIGYGIVLEIAGEKRNATIIATYSPLVVYVYDEKQHYLMPA